MRAVTIITLALVFLLAAGACDEEEEETPGSMELRFETLASGDQSGVRVETAEVFKLESEDDWEDFWDRHASPVVPAPTRPRVDFERSMVIAVVDQEQPSGGYSMEVKRILARGDRLEVEAERREPGEGCITTSVITKPFHIVETERSGLPAELRLGTERYEC